jgi:hypothetical protein
MIERMHVAGPVTAVSASAVQGSRKSDSGATAPAQETQGKEKENRSRHLLHCLTTEQTVNLEQTRNSDLRFVLFIGDLINGIVNILLFSSI